MANKGNQLERLARLASVSASNNLTEENPHPSAVSSVTPPVNTTLTAANAVQRARTNPAALTPANVLALQHTIGNRAVQRLLSQRNQIAPPTPQLSSQPVEPASIQRIILKQGVSKPTSGTPKEEDHYSKTAVTKNPLHQQVKASPSKVTKLKVMLGDKKVYTYAEAEKELGLKRDGNIANLFGAAPKKVSPQQTLQVPGVPPSLTGNNTPIKHARPESFDTDNVGPATKRTKPNDYDANATNTAPSLTASASAIPTGQGNLVSQSFNQLPSSGMPMPRSSLSSSISGSNMFSGIPMSSAMAAQVNAFNSRTTPKDDQDGSDVDPDYLMALELDQELNQDRNPDYDPDRNQDSVFQNDYDSEEESKSPREEKGKAPVTPQQIVSNFQPSFLPSNSNWHTTAPSNVSNVNNQTSNTTANTTANTTTNMDDTANDEIDDVDIDGQETKAQEPPRANQHTKLKLDRFKGVPGQIGFPKKVPDFPKPYLYVLPVDKINQLGLMIPDSGNNEKSLRFDWRGIVMKIRTAAIEWIDIQLNADALSNSSYFGKAYHTIDFNRINIKNKNLLAEAVAYSQQNHTTQKPCTWAMVRGVMIERCVFTTLVHIEKPAQLLLQPKFNFNYSNTHATLLHKGIGYGGQPPTTYHAEPDIAWLNSRSSLQPNQQTAIGSQAKKPLDFIMDIKTGKADLTTQQARNYPKLAEKVTAIRENDNDGTTYYNDNVDSDLEDDGTPSS